MATITVPLDSTVQAGLAELAEARRQPISDVAADIIAMHVDRENWERQQILQGLTDLEAGRFVSHEQVVAWLESWVTENEFPVPTI
jgi:predicted transcriptional regulator